MIARFLLLTLAAMAAFLSGCATESFAPDQAPEMAIIRDHAQFYRFGPSQAAGPDATLRVDTRVKLLRREMGYSLVQMEDSRTGYIANEDFAPAPPRPKPEVASAETGSSRSSNSRKPNSPRYQGEQVNDTPLPEPPISMDLNVGPDDVVPAAPAPVEVPAEAPKFRY